MKSLRSVTHYCLIIGLVGPHRRPSLAVPVRRLLDAGSILISGFRNQSFGNLSFLVRVVLTRTNWKHVTSIIDPSENETSRRTRRRVYHHSDALIIIDYKSFICNLLHGRFAAEDDMTSNGEL